MFSIKKLISKRKPLKGERVPDRITQAILEAQRKTADYLSRKTAGWSPHRTKTALILFCLVMGGTSLFIALRAIRSANGPPSSSKRNNYVHSSNTSATKASTTDSIFKNMLNH